MDFWGYLILFGVGYCLALALLCMFMKGAGLNDEGRNNEQRD